jgi:hypothetical protein
MNPRYLIDQLVRQTTVLIAQLSTTAGIRAPLAHVADQVFVELSREIESQGISRKVAADMFGLALRTYQTRVQRLSQSQTMSDRTLWQAVLDFVAEQGNPSRSRILDRFRSDGELAVGAVLNDLTASGLISVTGKGPNAICRITSEADRLALSKSADADTVASLLWVQIYRDGPLNDAALHALWPDHELLERALGVLERDQRIVKLAREDGTVEHRASAITIPVGDRMGWEGAVLDHFQAVAKAIAHKLRLIGATERNHTDLIGGATLTFDLRDGHPLEAEVKGLLKRVRDDANALWNRLKEHNEREPIADDQRRRVVFYFGQDVEETDDV